jgi:hypothetical protein
VERESVSRIVHVAHGPPDNELPVALPSGISWHGAGVVLAILALLLYSTGIELLIMFRSEWQQVPAEDLSTAVGWRWHASTAAPRARDIGEKLNGLQVNGRPVTQLGEDFNDHGFNGRAWVPAGVLIDGEQILTLDRPGIANAERRIGRAAIVDAMPRISAIW